MSSFLSLSQAMDQLNYRNIFVLGESWTKAVAIRETLIKQCPPDKLRIRPILLSLQNLPRINHVLAGVRSFFIVIKNREARLPVGLENRYSRFFSYVYLAEGSETTDTSSNFSHMQNLIQAMDMEAIRFSSIEFSPPLSNIVELAHYFQPNLTKNITLEANQLFHRLLLSDDDSVLSFWKLPITAGTTDPAKIQAAFARLLLQLPLIINGQAVPEQWTTLGPQYSSDYRKLYSLGPLFLKLFPAANMKLSNSAQHYYWWRAMQAFILIAQMSCAFWGERARNNKKINSYLDDVTDINNSTTR